MSHKIRSVEETVRHTRFKKNVVKTIEFFALIALGIGLYFVLRK